MFVVWHKASIHVERVIPDNDLVADVLSKSEKFFNLCVLPEPLGKWFTRSRTDIAEVEVSDTDEQDDGKWCYCKQSQGGEMIGCENPKCETKWFHLACLQMKTTPKGKWFCPSCHPNKKPKNNFFLV